MRRNQRSAKAKQYINWYKTTGWETLRKAQLWKEPTCRMCRHEGKLTAATVVDHIDPHHGDYNLFFTSKLQSLCKPHHDSKKQSIERRGYDTTAIGTDGWPSDPKHPFLK